MATTTKSPGWFRRVGTALKTNPLQSAGIASQILGGISAYNEGRAAAARGRRAAGMALSRGELDVSTMRAQSTFTKAQATRQFASAIAQQKLRALASGTTGTGVMEDSITEFGEDLDIATQTALLRQGMRRLAAADQNEAYLYEAARAEKAGMFGLASGILGVVQGVGGLGAK